MPGFGVGPRRDTEFKAKPSFNSRQWHRGTDNLVVRHNRQSGLRGRYSRIRSSTGRVRIQELVPQEWVTFKAQEHIRQSGRESLRVLWGTSLIASEKQVHLIRKQHMWHREGRWEQEQTSTNKHLLGSHKLCDSLFPSQYTVNIIRFTIKEWSCFSFLFLCFVFFLSPNSEKNRNYIWYKGIKKSLGSVSSICER